MVTTVSQNYYHKKIIDKMFERKVLVFGGKGLHVLPTSFSQPGIEVLGKLLADLEI